MAGENTLLEQRKSKGPHDTPAAKYRDALGALDEEIRQDLRGVHRHAIVGHENDGVGVLPARARRPIVEVRAHVGCAAHLRERSVCRELRAYHPARADDPGVEMDTGCGVGFFHQLLCRAHGLRPAEELVRDVDARIVARRCESAYERWL